MTESLMMKVSAVIERAVALFVEPCPLCSKKPMVQLFYWTGNIGTLSLEPPPYDPREERWRLRIACWDNDLPRDKICMLKTPVVKLPLWSAILFSVKSWNNEDYRNTIREQCLGKSYEERSRLSQEITPGIYNGGPNVAWVKKEILDAITT